MLHVQEFLKTKTLAALEQEHGVKGRISAERPYKCSLNYDQILAREGDELAQQCRGLVLRTADGSQITEDSPLGETKVVARAFHRFFNDGQGAAAEVDLEHPETAIFEKLDGTLCIVYYDDVHGEWHVATRSISEANLPVNGWEDYTFRTLFEEALQKTAGIGFSEWALGLDLARTYLFELCTPMNQVVVAHEDYSVTLIGCRETQTGREFWPHEVAPQIGVPHVDRHRFGNVEEMLEFVRQRDPRKFEGIVACQEAEPGTFRRIKIKNVQYLAYSRLKDAVSSPRNVMTLILGENLDDAFVVMPEDLKQRALNMQEGIRRMFFDYKRDYQRLYDSVCASIPDEPHGSKEHRKAFALAAKASGIWFEPAMMQYSGRCQDAHSFVYRKREKDGSYPSSFLDYLITQAERKIGP